MLFLKKEAQPRVCPKTGKIIDPVHNKKWAWWLFPFTGLAALIWFLIRVIPKPSRAAYPCQRLAFPLASGFIVWIAGLAASTIAFHKAKRHLVRARYVLAAICIVISVASIYVALSYTSQDKTLAAYGVPPFRIAQPANSPIGVGKGVHPGRVAWIYDPNATNWLGSYDIQKVNDGYWWEPNHTDQNVVTAMVSKSLRSLTGKSSDYAAWDAIFRYFNQQHGKGNVGYQPHEKIMIKVNFVGLITSATGTGTSSYTFKDNYPNVSPQAIHALLDQLVNIVGVNDVDITVGDTLCTFTNTYYTPLHTDFPDVNYIDYQGLLGRGKTVTPSTNPRVYWGDPLSNNAANKDYVPNAYKNATYIINFANLKGHYNQACVTMCGKNHYGTLCRTPNQSGYYDLHSTQVWTVPGMGHYRPLVDFMGHPEIGGKTVLYLIDGLYPNKHASNWMHDFPYKWMKPPFNNDWASSFLASQDPVAIDSVGFDFLYNEWSYEPNGPGGDGADDYLHEAASIPNPPSGTIYDPNHDGRLTASLGVHEHWNDANNKQYTRNLGTGNGIELVTNTPGWTDLNYDGFVDFKDFAILANAWRSRSGDTNWDANCDISSTPGDGVIDEKDLYVLADNWLTDYTTTLVAPGATLQQVYSDPNYDFEGPTWDPNSNKLFFTKRPASSGTYQILRLDSPNNVTVWMTPSPQTNGTVLSLDGRLLTADESTMQIRSHIIGDSGPQDTVVVANTPKKPNDLCELTNGDIYFTCPDWNGVGPTGQGVYLLEPNGVITRVNNSLYQPNGILTSLDETKLYVSESSSSNLTYKRWWVFPINSDGTLGTGSVFFKPTNLTGMGTSDPDGMTIDERGNLYFTGLGGVWIVSPTGTEIKRIPTPNVPANVCFGGPEYRTLYITCNYKVYSLAMVVRGGE
ncbi:MAG: SMP-30/gluconolactonase/LRE family protein [Sedimentisphaerales bacterium]|jgi:sugar lactone lactonase YvrE